MTHKYDTYGHRFVVKILSGRSSICVAFDDFYDLLKFAYTYNLVKKTVPYF
jgi:hypothetical protein